MLGEVENVTITGGGKALIQISVDGRPSGINKDAFSKFYGALRTMPIAPLMIATLELPIITFTSPSLTTS